MSIYTLTGAVMGFGAVGGLVNCLLAGARHFWPRYDSDNAWQPGWFGSMILGGVAAAVIWGIYGPLASYDLAAAETAALHLTLAQLLTSLVVGMSGSRILTLETQKQILRAQRDGEAAAKDKLAEASEELLEEAPDEPDESHEQLGQSESSSPSQGSP